MLPIYMLDQRENNRKKPVEISAILQSNERVQIFLHGGYQIRDLLHGNQEFYHFANSFSSFSPFYGTGSAFFINLSIRLRVLE
jgi:hypothetical protein